MKPIFNFFDVVKIKDGVDIPELSGKNVYGIIHECNDICSYATWIGRATATKTRKINYDKWVKNTDLVLVGDTCSLIFGAISKTTKIKVREHENTDNVVVLTKPTVTTPISHKSSDAKAEHAGIAKETKSSNGITYVPRPKISKSVVSNERYLCADSLRRKHYYIIATGKFQYFTNRKDIINSINLNNAYYHNKLDWNLDVAVVGEKPGPNKIEFFNKHGIPVITEAQWLAFIGHPLFKFEDERSTSDVA